MYTSRASFHFLQASYGSPGRLTVKVVGKVVCEYVMSLKYSSKNGLLVSGKLAQKPPDHNPCPAFKDQSLTSNQRRRYQEIGWVHAGVCLRFIERTPGFPVPCHAMFVHRCDNEHSPNVLMLYFSTLTLWQPPFTWAKIYLGRLNGPCLPDCLTSSNLGAST